MNPQLGLHFASVLLNFLLRVTAACLVCWILSRLLRHPRQRFYVWTAFLLGSAGYWLALVVREAGAVLSMAAPPNIPHPAPAQAGALIVPAVSVPTGWSHSLPLVLEVLGLAYGTIVALLLLRSAWSYLRLRLLLRRGIEASTELQELFDELRGDMKVAHAKLLVLPGLKSPATAGWPRACVLLPEVCEDLGPTPQVADVLCHELVHVQQRDYFWAGLGNLVCCLLFFHPAIWNARSWMVLQGELACDEGVLHARPGDRADYAESLTYFVRLRMLQEGFSLGVDFAASAALGLRIRSILRAPQPLRWWQRVSRTTAGLAMLGTLAALVPALTVLFRFAPTDLDQPSVTPLIAQAPIANAHSSHRALRRPATQPQSPDTLTTLGAQKYIPETPAYTMTSGDSRSNSRGSVDFETPVWKESTSSVHLPSASNVVLTTLGQIAISTRRGGRGRDSDDH